MGITALLIAFIYQWKLTLLIFAFVPFLMVAGAMHTKMMTSFAQEENDKLVEAGAVRCYLVFLCYLNRSS